MKPSDIKCPDIQMFNFYMHPKTANCLCIYILDDVSLLRERLVAVEMTMCHIQKIAFQWLHKNENI